MSDELRLAVGGALAIGTLLAVLGVRDFLAWIFEGGPDDAGEVSTCFICGDPARVPVGRVRYCVPCSRGEIRR